MRNLILTLLLISFCLKIQAGNVSDLNNTEQQQLYNILTTNYCSCGCTKTILQCINTDPSCTTAPQMRQSIIDSIVSNRANYEPLAYPGVDNNSGGGNPTFEDGVEDFCARNGCSISW